MRLLFPNHEHESVLIAPGDSTMGCAPDNRIVLKGEGIAAYHAKITVDARGYVLTVLDSQARVHVNARPVREKAILRLGDIVTLGLIQLLLKPDTDEEIHTQIPSEKSNVSSVSEEEHLLPARIVLRGISGAYFGKIIPVRKSLSIGRSSDSGLQLNDPAIPSHQALIEQVGNQIYLRVDEATPSVSVNGVKVKNAVLYQGDQLVFGHQRFVLEAPGWPTREQGERESIRETPALAISPEVDQSQTKHLPQHSAKNCGILWLIAVAILLGLLIGWLLFNGF